VSAPTISFEFFPPKDVAGEERLWGAIEALGPIAPDYVSVTYGAGGSTRDRTISITSEITKRTQIPTIAHLTCVGSTQEEILHILTRYRDAGIKSILALRGDPEGGPRAPWVTIDGGLNHADELVALASEFGDFTVGVAAFPDGHPASHGNLDKDIDVLIRKEDLGASFATTQFFFDASKWSALVARLDERGSKLPVIPGIMPVTNVKQLVRMSELTGTPIPDAMRKKFEAIESDADAVRALGIEIATEFCQKLLSAGAPGLHFYTMNTSTATSQIYENLALKR
jgi:methylenetetrahydrofolate reductase (NADPH)